MKLHRQNFQDFAEVFHRALYHADNVHDRLLILALAEGVAHVLAQSHNFNIDTFMYAVHATGAKERKED